MTSSKWKRPVWLPESLSPGSGCYRLLTEHSGAAGSHLLLSSQVVGVSDRSGEKGIERQLQAQAGMWAAHLLAEKPK